MRIAHLADSHLGHRRFDRTGAAGLNQREADVAAAFRHAMVRVREAAPDLVVIAGDLFDRVRPSNHAITAAYVELHTLVEALPDVHVVVVGGNHEIPRTTETGCILDLFARVPRVHVIWQRPTRLVLPCGVVWGVPEGHEPPATPEGILILHGDVAGTIPQGDRPTQRIDPAQLAGWRLVCLGHYHVHRQVAPRAWYAGSLDRVSSNPWDELREEAAAGLPGKGWLLIDLPDAGDPALMFQSVPTRRFVDLPPLEGTGLGAAQLDAAIADRMAEVGSLEGAVVRLVVREVTRDVRRALNHRQIREWKARALHFQLELRRAEQEVLRVARAVRGRPLDQLLAEALQARPLDPAIDRAAFLERGLAAFAEVGLDPKRDPYTGEPVPGL